MDLKKYFPVSYEKSLFGAIIKYLVVVIVASLLIWLSTALTGWIPVVGGLIGWILGIVSALVDLYAVAGIVIAVLVTLKILK